MFFFWRMLVKHGVHFSLYFGKPPAFAVMDKYDSIPKALLGLVGYLPLYIINLPISLPLFLVGHVLYCCKVMPISRVSNLWLRLYTRSNKHTSNVVIIIPLLQESIFEEMLTESVPQMIIQIVNNTFTNVWSPLSYFSTTMSALMILNGIWRLCYYRLYLKIKIDAIPTDLSNDVFSFKSIEEGEKSLGKAVKVAAQIELDTIVSAVSPCSTANPHAPFVLCTRPKVTVLQMAESDEMSPLIQRHVAASAAELRAEIQILKSEMSAQNEHLHLRSLQEAAALKTELMGETIALKSAFMDETIALKSDIQEINRRSLRMEAQLQELISRAGPI
jgi:hypothetical protein